MTEPATLLFNPVFEGHRQIVKRTRPAFSETSGLDALIVP